MLDYDLTDYWLLYCDFNLFFFVVIVIIIRGIRIDYELAFRFRGFVIIVFIIFDAIIIIIIILAVFNSIVIIVVVLAILDTIIVIVVIFIILYAIVVVVIVVLFSRLGGQLILNFLDDFILDGSDHFLDFVFGFQDKLASFFCFLGHFLSHLRRGLLYGLLGLFQF